MTGAVAVAVFMLAPVAACAREGSARWSAPAPSTASALPSPVDAASQGATPGPSASGSAGPAAGAPSRAFAVGVRTVNLTRAADRPLPTTIWYPATGAAGAAGTARSGAQVADGRFPLVLFSHGLTGMPQNYAGITTRLAAAGFVIAAPAYPYTNHDAATKNFADVVNQPADGAFVVDQVLRLGQTAGDGLSGHLDPQNVAAAGHSAGGFTTAGMLSTRHDARLRAGIIIAGGSMGTFTAPAASVLFIHGDADPTVSYQTGRAAYDRLSWPKAFLTVIGGDHTTYIGTGRDGNAAAVKTMIDFLRAALYADGAARSRLAADGASAVTRYEQRLG
jgi:fermentation-respiration switch protein FrsA (DUF1100 family)